MSFDFATNQICTHEVFFERLTVSANQRIYAPFLRPPSSSMVEVYLDGKMIPSTGYLSYAELPFIRPEPYRIKTGVNDLLYISIGFEAPRFVQLISGPNLKAIDIVRDLQTKIPELYISVKNRRVVIRSRQRTAGTAFSFPDPRWTDATSSLPTTVQVLETFKSVGINPGRHVYGRKLFPGWTVRQDPVDTTGTQKQLLFDQPLSNADAVLEVNYVTNQFNCRRCYGTRVEFDYSVKDGTYEIVKDTDLLAQEFDKFVFTKIGSHWKWSWVGSGIIDRIGGKGSLGTVNMNAILTVDISQAFRVYQNIKQQQDSGFPQQQVSDAEFPNQLTNLNVKPLPDDPTVAVVEVTISSRSREPVELKRVVGNPNPFTLLGDPRENLRQGNRANFLLRG